MRQLFIALIALVAGCALNDEHCSRNVAWVQPVEQKLSLLEHHYRKWDNSRRTAHLPSSADYWAVQYGIWDLWILTGRCLFSDIPCAELVQNAPKICTRYTSFIREHANKHIQEVLLESVEENIELIPTEYCWPALYIIQRRVNFENPIMIAGYPRCFEVPNHLRRRAYQAMRRWLEENKNELTWNPFLKNFNRYGLWAVRPFTLPDEVDEAVRSISDGSEDGPTSLKLQSND